MLMSDYEFPSNSDASKRSSEPDKNITRVTKGDAVRRRKSLRKQFSDTFVAGDFKGAMRYVVLDVLLPAAKDTIVEIATQGTERLLFGESRRRGGYSPQTGPYGHIAYNRIATAAGSRIMSSSAERAMSRHARVRHNFDEIILNDRTEAEEVIDRLFDLVSRYDTATVADLYELVGLASNHTDTKWGWSNLAGAGVSRVRGGYLLDLPDPHPIN
jgi:hypothetical protein